MGCSSSEGYISLMLLGKTTFLSFFPDMFVQNAKTRKHGYKFQRHSLCSRFLSRIIELSNLAAGFASFEVVMIFVTNYQISKFGSRLRPFAVHKIFLL